MTRCKKIDRLKEQIENNCNLELALDKEVKPVKEEEEIQDITPTTKCSRTSELQTSVLSPLDSLRESMLSLKLPI